MEMPLRDRITALILCCSVAFVPAVAAGFDLKGSDPSKLLDLLVNGNFPAAVLTINEPVENWVQEKDLPKLILLLDSPVPCAPVALSKSSFWPGVSSIGEQAAFLIQGFRAGLYPPDLHSGRMGPGVKNEIRAWWAVRKPGLCFNVDFLLESPCVMGVGGTRATLLRGRR